MILAAAHTRVSLRREHPGLGACWHQRVATYVQMDRVQENQVQARFFDFFGSVVHDVARETCLA